MPRRTAPTLHVVCPVCGGPGVLVLHGLPGPDLFDAARRGEVILGGCVITGEDATHGCREGHRWRLVVLPSESPDPRDGDR